MISYAKDILRNLYVEYSMPISVYDSKESEDKVLICYIKSPFYLNKRPIKHCNVFESRIIAKTFYKLGYSVDVVDYRCKRKIDYSKYSIIFGFGLSYRNVFNESILIKKICYLTGANPNFSNTQEALRIKDVFQNKGILMRPRREAYWPWMHTAINSDHLIVTGNQFTKNSYNGLNTNTTHMPVPFISSTLDVKSNIKSNKGFLWFGGAGAIFKGLDLVIDAIDECSEDIKLDICGPIKEEKDFMNYYDASINKNKNINFHGMLDVNSREMQLLVEQNSFVILPSCSEGGASSVLTCMNLGLIPIVTKECSINLDGFGIKIEGFSKEHVLESIITALSMTDEDINNQRLLIKSFLKDNHSSEAIEAKFTSILKNII